MSTFDKIKELATSKGMSIAELERTLKFGTNSIYAWKNHTPNVDRLKQVADFFNVSTDYLLGRTNKQQWELSETEKKDVQEFLTYIYEGISNSESLSEYKNGGNELREDDAQLLRASLEQTIRLSKELSKKKNSSKDYNK